MLNILCCFIRDWFG